MYKIIKHLKSKRKELDWDQKYSYIGYDQGSGLKAFVYFYGLT